MAIHDLWSYDHAPQSTTDISAGTSLTAYSESGTYNRYTGLPGMLYKNTSGTAAITTDGFLTMTVASGLSPALLIQPKEVQDWSAATTKYWIGFRTKTTVQNGAGGNIFAISDSLANTNFQALLQESDMTSNGVSALNTEYYVEIFIDRTGLTYQVWVNGVLIKSGNLQAAVLPSGGNGYYWWGAYNTQSGQTNGAVRCFRDFYFLDVDATYTGRLGSIRSALQSIASVTCPNYIPNAGVTLSGSAAVVATQSKFGGSSLSLGATTSSAGTIADATALHLSGDCTIECWVYMSSLTASGLFCKDSNASPYARLTFNGTSWLLYTDSASAIITATANITANTWVHIAAVHYGSTWYLYQNGVLLGSAASSSTFGNNSSSLIIGNTSALNSVFPGYIDEFRISNIARYTAAFTPPSASFATDANTVSLVHFDSSVGSVTGDMEQTSGVLNSAYQNPPLASPALTNAPSKDPLTIALSTSYTSGKTILAVDFRVAAQPNNSPASLATALQLGGNNVLLGTGTYSFQDSAMNYGRRLGLAKNAPDGGAWTTAKISATSLILTPN